MLNQSKVIAFDVDASLAGLREDCRSTLSREGPPLPRLAFGNRELQALACQPTALLEPSVSRLIPWRQAYGLLWEIEDHLRLEPENGQDGDVTMRLLVERIPAILEELKQAHEDLDRRVAQRTAELSRANAVLKVQITEAALAERRLAVEHEVAQILAESSTLAEAAAKILQSISQSLGWDVGALWTLDREAEALRCIEIWHAPMVDVPAFEQASRLRALAAGMDLPGRVWTSGSPVWIPDVSQDANFPRAPIAAKEGLHAAVAFPIRNDDFLGVMEFFSLEIRQPDKELLQMMISIGSHISQFIDRMKAEKALLLKEVELSIAQKIQQGLVAKIPPALAGFEIAGASHCAAETGGDYFDFFPLLDSCQGIVIADASGHGLGPALLITETRAYLRAFALTSEDIGRIAALVNRRLAADVGDDYFVTLFLARLDPRTRSLLYTSAGHPKGCIFDSAGNVKAFLESTSPPLGIFPDGDFPIGPAMTLQPGDLVLLLTDGVIEARAPDDTPFGLERAIDIVRAYRKETAALIVHNLYHAVRAFCHNQAQVDDITAVVIKVQEVSPPNHLEVVKVKQTPKSWVAKARAFPRKVLTALGGALKRGILGKSSHSYMKQFTGSDEYFAEAIAAQRGCRQKPSKLDPEPAPEPVHWWTKQQGDNYLARNPAYRSIYEAELLNHRFAAAPGVNGSLLP